MNAGPTRILVVDDSALYRQSITNVLREVADVAVVGTAKDGVEALEKVEQLDPDLLTLDVQMPDMDGIRVLHEMKRRHMRAKAIMVSNFTSEGAQVTTDALMQGAFDFILKPSSGDSAVNRQQLLEALAVRISAFRQTALDRATSTRTAHRAVAANGLHRLWPSVRRRRVYPNARRLVGRGGRRRGPNLAGLLLLRRPDADTPAQGRSVCPSSAVYCFDYRADATIRGSSRLRTSLANTATSLRSAASSSAWSCDARCSFCTSFRSSVART